MDEKIIWAFALQWVLYVTLLFRVSRLEEDVARLKVKEAENE